MGVAHLALALEVITRKGNTKYANHIQKHRDFKITVFLYVDSDDIIFARSKEEKPAERD